MLKLGFAQLKAKTEALFRTFERAKAICMTIDGFVQHFGGVTGNAKLLQGLEIVAAEIHEFAAADTHQIAPVAARVKFLIPLWDPAQRIERGTQESKVTVNDTIPKEIVTIGTVRFMGPAPHQPSN